MLKTVAKWYVYFFRALMGSTILAVVGLCVFGIIRGALLKDPTSILAAGVLCFLVMVFLYIAALERIKSDPRR